MNTSVDKSRSFRRAALVARMLLAALVGLGIGTAPAFGQDPHLKLESLDRLASRAVETVDVTIDASMLHMASKFLNVDKADEAKLRELLQQLKGVHVKVFEFASDGAYTAEDVEAIRAQLSAPGWSKVATIRTKRTSGGEDVDVRFMFEGDLIKGIAIFVADPRELVLVNVIGPIDPEKISQLNLLEGRFGIPRIGLGWGETKKLNNNN